MNRNPTFQHHHYTNIAAAIANTTTRNELIEELISMFRRDNPRFDYARFDNACRGTPTKKDHRTAA